MEHLPESSDKNRAKCRKEKAQRCLLEHKQNTAIVTKKFLHLSRKECQADAPSLKFCTSRLETVCHCTQGSEKDQTKTESKTESVPALPKLNRTRRGHPSEAAKRHRAGLRAKKREAIEALLITSSRPSRAPTIPYSCPQPPQLWQRHGELKHRGLATCLR